MTTDEERNIQDRHALQLAVMQISTVRLKTDEQRQLYAEAVVAVHKLWKSLESAEHPIQIPASR